MKARLLAVSIVSLLLVFVFLAVNVLPVQAAQSGNGKDKDHKVTICHKGQTISVDKHSLKKHIAHGDHKGPCKGGDEPPDQETPPQTPPQTPPDDKTPPDKETPPAPGSPPVVIAGGGDSDVAAITRTGDYNAETGVITVYTVGGVGSFSLTQKGKRGRSWFELPGDWTAINQVEHRATLNIGELSTGTYCLFAHQWQTRNSGDDCQRIDVP